MANRVPASIRIGGNITPALFDAVVATICFEGLTIAWGDRDFVAEDRVVGEPLELFDEECAWGQFDTLEAFCVEQKLPFVRWAGGYPGEWSPERLVFRGHGEPESYMVDENDNVVIDRRQVVELGSIEAALDYFDAAEFDVPPLVVEGDPPPTPVAESAAVAGEVRHG